VVTQNRPMRSPENRPTIKPGTLTLTRAPIASVSMSNVLSEEKKQQVIALGKARMADTAHRASPRRAPSNSRRLPQGGRERSTSTARLGATSAGGQARVIAYAYGNADLKKLNEATVLASRQAGQVNELERDWRKRRQIVPIRVDLCASRFLDGCRSYGLRRQNCELALDAPSCCEGTIGLPSKLCS